MIVLVLVLVLGAPVLEGLEYGYEGRRGRTMGEATSPAESAVSITLTVNGDAVEISAPSHWRLLDLLRDGLGLTGTKEGCAIGECGACTVLLDGKPVNSCLVLAAQADGCQVETVEGLAEGGDLHPLQEAFMSHDAVQCGFCTPGMLMSAKALLAGNPKPSAEEVRKALAGNLCRCTGYAQIVEAVMDAARALREER